MFNKRLLDFKSLDKSDIDVLIIGGGINGLGIALDCQLRGLSTLLIDKSDFSSGASSNSTKLVHGGLRYLKQFKINLVRQSLKERHYLHQNAPHLVKPIPFILPLYEDTPYSSFMLRCGLRLYHILGAGDAFPSFQFLTPLEALNRQPNLKSSGLKGAFLYYDAQMKDARICIELAKESRFFGAKLFNYAFLVSIKKNSSGVKAVAIKCAISNTIIRVKPAYVINTTGAWSDFTQKTFFKKHKKLLRRSKGVHFMTSKLQLNQAFLFHSKRDDRVFFAIPFFGLALIGTTDTDFKGNSDHVYPSKQDLRYLIDSLHSYFPDLDLNIEDINSAFAGLRPLFSQKDASVSAVSREHHILTDQNVLQVVGGKYTTYRLLAEQVTKKVVSFLNPGSPFVSMTKHHRFIGGHIIDVEDYIEKHYSVDSQLYPITQSLYRHLIVQYGSCFKDLFSLLFETDTARNPLPGSVHVEAEVIYAIRFEMAEKIIDFMRRRTHIMFKEDLGRTCLKRVADLFSEEKKWSSVEKEQYIQDYLDEVTLFCPNSIMT